MKSGLAAIRLYALCRLNACGNELAKKIYFLFHNKPTFFSNVVSKKPRCVEYLILMTSVCYSLTLECYITLTLGTPLKTKS